jgi:GDPmannose 4,6-dehydratase
LHWKDHVVIDESLLRPTDILEGCGNPVRAEKQLGWKAAYRLEDVVREMVRSELKMLSCC